MKETMYRRETAHLLRAAAESRWHWLGWVLLPLVLLGLTACGGGCRGERIETSYVDILGLTLSVPQWSPDGAQIMFEGMTVDGVDSPEGQRLGWVSPEAFRPDLSPDGSRVVYGQDPEEDGYSTVIETSKPDGSGRQRLTDDDEFYTFSPAWSPDGTRIAFARTTGLYVMAADGSDVRWIVRLAVERVSWGKAWHEWHAGPVWSPDGKALAFVVLEPAPDIPPPARRPTRYILHVAAADGSNSERVFAATGHGPRGLDLIGWPSWSPDGERLAFMRYVPWGSDSGRYSFGEEIDAPRGFTPYTIRRDGSGLREVAPGIPRTDWWYEHVLFPSASWSPDGTEILFALGDGHLYIAQADGGGYRQVGEGTYASWSPEGSRISVADPLGGRAAEYFDNGGRLAGTVSFDGVRLDGTERLRDPANSIPHDYLWTIAPDGSDRRVLVRRVEEGALVAAKPAPAKPWYRFLVINEGTYA